MESAVLGQLLFDLAVEFNLDRVPPVVELDDLAVLITHATGQKLAAALTQLAKFFLTLSDLGHLVNVEVLLVGHVRRIGGGFQRGVAAAGGVQFKLHGETLVEQRVVSPLLIRLADLQTVQVVFIQ